MRLYKDPIKFKDSILSTSLAMNMDPSLIEKDYFVVLFLENAAKRIPGLVFKGGTSLSKCYKLIDRFSEDIDLTLDLEHFTQGNKRNSVKELINVCDELGFEIINRNDVLSHSHGSYCKFEIKYPICFQSDVVNNRLIVEMVFIQKSFPIEKKTINSYIGENLLKIGLENITKEYEVEEFSINIQSLNRTLIDKVFAICDYYLMGVNLRYSRHIYDIFKLLTKIDIHDKELKNLIEQVKNIRSSSNRCLSAQTTTNINEILKDIVETRYYEKDYKLITEKLLIKPLSYDEAISSIERIIKSGLFE